MSQNPLNDEELKKRMKQLEYEIHKSQSPKTVLTTSTSNKILRTRKFPLKYKILVGFCLGFSFFIALGFLMGGHNAYLIFTSLMLFISTLSFATFMLISIIPTLLIIYIAWRVYESLAK